MRNGFLFAQCGSQENQAERIERHDLRWCVMDYAEIINVGQKRIGECVFGHFDVDIAYTHITH